MAPCTRNNNGDLVFRTEKPHFFKIIPSLSSSQQKLGIPRKFVINYGDDLPSPVFFKRDSEFNVFIFDNTATEIDYPFSLSSERHDLDHEQVPQDPDVVVDGEESDVSVEIKPSKVDLDQLFQNGVAEEPVRERVNRKTLTNAEKEKAVERAVSNFLSENPSFSVVIQPSYINKTNVFHIPSSFVRKVTIFTSSGNIKRSKPKLSSDYPKRKRGRPFIISNENHTTKKIKLQNSVRASSRGSPEGQVEGRKNTKPRTSFSSANPTFARVMQESNFLYRAKYCLRVPRKFAKNMELGSHTVNLQK
ncbi:hypothetical protein M5689_001703 [Euphorbia peplus]|nr:hypothetical protein M5689_001703 [Euphorbia peplus]